MVPNVVGKRNLLNLRKDAYKLQLQLTHFHETIFFTNHNLDFAFRFDYKFKLCIGELNSF